MKIYLTTAIEIIQKDWICNCGAYVIFSEKCPRCNKPKSTFVKNINNHENK